MGSRSFITMDDSAVIAQHMETYLLIFFCDEDAAILFMARKCKRGPRNDEEWVAMRQNSWCLVSASYQLQRECGLAMSGGKYQGRWQRRSFEDIWET